MLATPEARRDATSQVERGAGDDANPAPGRWLVALAGLLAALAGTYVVTCVIYNLPASVSGTEAHAASKAIMDPYIQQNWMLFGPIPTESQHQMLMQVQFAGSGAITPPVDIESPLDALPSANPVLPSKLPSFPMALKRRFAQYAASETRISREPEPARSQDAAATEQLYRNDKIVLQRFLSAEAAAYYPAQVISGVRCSFTEQADPPFNQRDLPEGTVQTRYLEYQTPWISYITGVGQ